MARFGLRRYFREQWRTLPAPKAGDDVGSKTFLVTGSNVGLGFEASVHLAEMQPKLLLVTCRDVVKCELTQKAIRERTTADDAAVCAWPLELESFQNVRSFVDKFATDGNGALHTLVANAGVFPDEHHTKTQDGWELTLQVNYLSNALLSILLLPYLINSASPSLPSRLVLVSSFAHYFVPGLKAESWNNVLETINQPGFGDSYLRYQVSKLLGIMFIRELASRLPKSASVIACAVDPGFCKSDIIRNQAGKWFISAFKQFFLVRSTEMGSRTLVHGAVATDPSMHGRYLSSCDVAEESDFLFTPEGKACSARVWDETITVLSGIDSRVSEIVEKFLWVNS